MEKMTGYVVLGSLLAVSLAFGGYEMSQKNKYIQLLDGNYQSAFNQGSNSIENVNNTLKKVRLSRMPQQNAVMFAELWKESAAAFDNMSRLPYNHEMIASSLKYLSQVSDLSYSMMNKSVDGKELTDEDWKRIDTLTEYSDSLTKEINTVLAQANMSRLNWNRLLEEAPSELMPESLLGSMAAVNKKFQDYPKLIYEGPLSDHMRTRKPEYTKGRSRISDEAGVAVVKSVLKDFDITEVRYAGTADDTLTSGVPAYSYETKVAGENQSSIWVNITKDGGIPLMLLREDKQDLRENLLSEGQAIDIAGQFLKESGFEKMRADYYELYENSITISFVATEREIILYPDLVKVKVSMTDGGILGFNANGYIMWHKERGDLKPSLTREQAELYISESFAVERVSLCIIPLEDGSEVLCHEFSGKLNDEYYRIYINAKTGKQEKIIELSVSDSGVLIL